jgi:hypothetical protein
LKRQEFLASAHYFLKKYENPGIDFLNYEKALNDKKAHVFGWKRKKSLCYKKLFEILITKSVPR